MTAIDLRTVYFMAGMLYLLMPAVVWLALREQKSPVVTLWCGGGELFGIAVLLLGMRDLAPDIITYELANLTIVVGNLFRVHALACELERPLPRWIRAVIPLGFFVIYTTCRWTQPENVIHVSFTLLVLATLLGWIALLAGELAQRDDSASARVLTGLYCFFAILMMLRALEVATGGDKGLFPTKVLAISMTVMSVITAVLGNTSFLGIFVERLARVRVLAAQERARRDEGDRLGRQIAELERQRTMGMLSTSLNHELSQPLTNMLLLANRAELETRKEGELTSPNARFVEGIQRNLRYAIAIVDRVRGFVKSENIEYQRVSLQETNANVMSILGDWLRYESVDVRLMQPDAPLWVRGDPVQLSQILVNIYRNAVQASAGQSKRILAITISDDDGLGRIQVHDNGPGFSEKSLSQAGMPFFTTKVDGLGIGLSIVRSIIEKHRGALKLSNAETGGAIVEISLPLA